jgi:hypothetical protein
MSKITLNPITDREYSAVEVPRGWSEIFAPLLIQFHLDHHGFPDHPTDGIYITETKKFKIHPYYDVDCTCGAEDDENGDLACEHNENCDLVQPNFLYKKTGFKLYWYKYPMRGSEMLPGITIAQFMEMILDCLKD